jgi:hypothetical protein
MGQATATLIAGVVASQAVSDATVARWQANGDTERLVDRAAQAEEYATAAVLLAWSSMEEASAALLEALVARFEAEAALASAVTCEDCGSSVRQRRRAEEARAPV